MQNISFYETTYNSLVEQLNKDGKATLITPKITGLRLGETVHLFEVKNGYDPTNVEHRAAKKTPYTGRDMRCYVKALFINDDKKTYGVIFLKAD